MELAFVNEPMNAQAVRDDETLPPGVALDDLSEWEAKEPDLIVEVAHPIISQRHGADFLRRADYLPASVTTFADAPTEAAMRAASTSGAGHGIYIPAGALWGARDIQNMAFRDNIRGLRVTMKKAPHHLKLAPGTPLFHKLEKLVQARRRPLATPRQFPHLLARGGLRYSARFCGGAHRTAGALSNY
jgi:hypothetical protein